MTYRVVQVEVDPLSRFKQLAQQAARTTTHWLERHNLTGSDRSRASSAFALWDDGAVTGTKRRWALTHEGLGTKSLVADAMKELTGRCYYEGIAQDTLAAGLNDCITGNVIPVVTSMHLAVGDATWFRDNERVEALITGWVNTCNFAQCSWGGGETPVLKDVVLPEASELSCSVLGVGESAWNHLGWNKVRHGDAIIVITTSGIHANGITQARSLADALPHGYLTEISDGRTFGEALLEPTPIYVPFIEDCFRDLGQYNLRLRYLGNLTGGGWRKLMRERGAYACVIDTLPEVPPLHGFIQEQGLLDDETAYRTFNMGGGYALFVGQHGVEPIVNLAAKHGLTAIKVGYVDLAIGDDRPDVRRVVMRPLGFEWEQPSI